MCAINSDDPPHHEFRQLPSLLKISRSFYATVSGFRRSGGTGVQSGLRPFSLHNPKPQILIVGLNPKPYPK